MSKIIKYGDEAINCVVKGIDTVADIVKTTVGPKGRNVLVRNQVSPPIITNDGVTIAKSIQLKDNVEDAGAQLIIQAANKTNDVAGDGTTTTTILAQEMIHQFSELKDNDANVVSVQKDMVKVSNEISEYLKSIATPIKDTESIKRVATISSGNEEIGKLIANAFEQAGEFGSVIVEDSKSGMDNLTSAQGMKLSMGMITPYLLLDRVNLKSDVKDVNVFVTTERIDTITDMIPLLNDCSKTGRNLLIICEDMGPDVLNIILMNKAKGAPLNISVIRTPGVGELRENLLNDICLATGATLVNRDNGITVKEYTPELLGEAEEVVISMDDTVIKFKETKSDGLNLLTLRKDRAQEINTLMQNVPISDRDQYKRRISNLISGISVIEVGGNSEVEIKDKKLRIEDAINSVQAAKEEGIVPGGGFSFISALLKASEEKRKATLGERVVYNSLSAITKQIAENAGYDGEMTFAECCNKKLGFNALTGNYENLIETGVINAVKVDRYALINATSVASTVITMGGLIAEENEKDQNILQLQGPIPGIM